MTNPRHLTEGIVRTHLNLRDFEITVVSPEVQRAAGLVIDQFATAADMLAEARASVAAARTELIALTSSLVQADVR